MVPVFFLRVAESQPYPVCQTFPPYLAPVRLSGFQSLSNFHEVPRKEFQIFNSAVSPIANSWARVTRTYQNYPLLHQFMHSTPDQVVSMWDRYGRELNSFHSELVVRHIVNKNDENRTRLPVYRKDLESL
jgi:hypothetical protein